MVSLWESSGSSTNITVKRIQRYRHRDIFSFFISSSFLKSVSSNFHGSKKFKGPTQTGRQPLSHTERERVQRKGRQRIYFPTELVSFHVSRTLLKMFFTESVLTWQRSMVCWCNRRTLGGENGNCSQQTARHQSELPRRHLQTQISQQSREECFLSDPRHPLFTVSVSVSYRPSACQKPKHVSFSTSDQ